MLAQDPLLIEFGVDKDVISASPTTLEAPVEEPAGGGEAESCRDPRTLRGNVSLASIEAASDAAPPRSGAARDRVS